MRSVFAAPAGETAYGAAVAPAGDIDGDGFVGALIGAPGTSVGGTANVGRVWVLYGSDGGVNGGTAVQSPTGFASRFGASVVGLGDINLDGFADFAVGAPAGIPGAPGGRVYVFYGNPSRTLGLPAFAIDPPLSLLAFGASMAVLGDFNGDGNGDVAVGAHDTNNGNGGVAVVLGPIRPSSAVLFGVPSNVVSLGMNAGYGRALAGIGDFNGGGLDDFVSTAPSGRLAMVIPGSNGTMPLSTGIVLRNLLGDGGTAPAGFGAAVTGGRINGDTFADVMVSAPDEGAGQALLYQGGMLGTPAGVDPIAVMGATAGTSRCGVSLSLVGDFDGDFRPDVFMGGPLAPARLFRGSYSSLRFVVVAVPEADGTAGANAVLACLRPPRLGWGG